MRAEIVNRQNVRVIENSRGAGFLFESKTLGTPTDVVYSAGLTLPSLTSLLRFKVQVSADFPEGAEWMLKPLSIT